MKHLFFLFIIILLSACKHSQTNKSDGSNMAEPAKISLAGTEWQCKIAEGCINVYKFKNDSSYIFYSCEMEDSLYGSYFFKQDTLILDEKGSIYDMPDDEYKVTRKKYYIVIKDDKLKHVKMYEWFNGKFELSDFKFDDSYSYKKVN